MIPQKIGEDGMRKKDKKLAENKKKILEIEQKTGFSGFETGKTGFWILKKGRHCFSTKRCKIALIIGMVSDFIKQSANI